MRSLVAILSLCSLFISFEALGQHSDQTARSFVHSPAALGMGDAGVALDFRDAAFFYNPAAISRINSIKPRIDIIGARASVSTDLFGKIRFFHDRLEPAIDGGIENQPPDDLQRLYDDMWEIARQQTQLQAGALLPSVMMNIGGVGAGGGLFTQSYVRNRIGDAGAGVPLLDFYGRMDVIAVATGGLDLSRYGVSGLSAGLTAKHTWRYLTLKNKAVDAFKSDEKLYLLRGSSVGFDLGLLYDVRPVPGLVAGLAIYDAIASEFQYNNASAIGGEEVEPTDLAEDIALAARMPLRPSYRIGAAYMFPRILPGLLISDAGVALDYVGYSDAPIKQAFLTNIHMGGQVQLVGLVNLRAGIGQGYPSFGVGLRLGIVHLDYAFYGQEAGRIPGQLPSWNHLAQIKFGLF